MDKLAKSLIFAEYNKQKGAGLRGQLDLARVNRALGYILSGKIVAKRLQYGTTADRCYCPDAIERGMICKHRIAVIILNKVTAKLRKLWLGEITHPLW